MVTYSTYQPTPDDIEVMRAIRGNNNRVSDRVLSNESREKVKPIWRTGYVEMILKPSGSVWDRVYRLTDKGERLLNDTN